MMEAKLFWGSTNCGGGGDSSSRASAISSNHPNCDPDDEVGREVSLLLLPVKVGRLFNCRFLVVGGVDQYLYSNEI